MTAVAAPDVGARDPAGPALAFRQTLSLSRRAVISTLRKPAAFVPGLFFPLLMAAVYSSQFDRVTATPGFPEVDSFLQFILPATILQGVAFGSTIGGVEMAQDIESGFFDRLTSAPVARPAIFLSRVAGSAAFAAVEALILIGVLTAFGARVSAGFGGVAAIVVISVFLAVALGGFGLAIAIRSGNAEVVQGIFPAIFALLFVSTAFFPPSLMKGWFRVIAEANPVSTVIDAMRHLVIVGWSTAEFGKAIAVLVAISAVSLSLAYSQYRHRVKA
ncbi:MAG: ABC transporter permease [Acidimicrobiales bacterium]|nr:ABC transporter permease [Acidimicrobiales bacterium]